MVHVAICHCSFCSLAVVVVGFFQFLWNTLRRKIGHVNGGGHILLCGLIFIMLNNPGWGAVGLMAAVIVSRDPLVLTVVFACQIFFRSWRDGKKQGAFLLA